MDNRKRQYMQEYRARNKGRAKENSTRWWAANGQTLLARKKEERAAARAALPPPPPYVPPAEKACTKCLVVKPLLDFKPHHQTRDGKNVWCRPCDNLSSARSHAARRAADPVYREALAEQKRAARRAADPLLAERDAQRAAQAALKADHRAHVDARQRWLGDCRAHVDARAEWLADVPPPPRRRAVDHAQTVYERAKSAFRRARRLGRLAPWCTIGDTLLFYERAAALEKITGVEWSVDHRVPLRAVLACGLHCPANLQVVPRIVNEGKSNMFIPEYA